MIDAEWLNDRSEFQQNFVHGLRNPHGLQLQFEVEDERIFTVWTADERHVGFPGFVHGGLIAAALDDVMGRWAALHRRFLVTARIEIRYRDAAPLHVPLRIEGWASRMLRRSLHAEGRVLLPDGGVVAEATGTYLPLPRALQARMVDAWPGFQTWLEQASTG